MSMRREIRLGLLGFVALGLVLTLAAGGCTEKIAGPGQAAHVDVSLDIKAGPTVSFRLRVTGADMDTISVPMVPDDDRVVTALSIPAGSNRRFLAEALDVTGTVLYSGVAVRDVTVLLPLDLIIDLVPVAPLLYLNPHFDNVALGSEFSFVVNVNELPGTTGAGIGFSLAGFGEKQAFIAEIDTLLLAPEQIARGSSLGYDTYGGHEVYFTISNEGPIVDEEGDGALVIIRCRTQDTLPLEPVDILPQMFIETLPGYLPPLEGVFIDTARIRIERERSAVSYLGGPYSEQGAALVTAGDGEAVLAATTPDPEGDLVPQLFVAGIGPDLQPVWTSTLPWLGGETTRDLARAADGGYYVCGSDGGSDGAVVSLDGAGNEIWREDVRGHGGGLPVAVAARPSGGCVAVGRWNLYENQDQYLIVFDADGYLNHHAPEDGSYSKRFTSVVALDDSTFVAAGYEYEYSAGNDTDAVLTKFALGAEISEQWYRNIGNTFDDNWVYDLVSLDDGGFLVVGSTEIGEAGWDDLYVVRTDQDGHPVWTRTFGSPDKVETGLGVCRAPDGGFVVAGYSVVPDSNGDIYVIKIDGDGNLIWENTLGGPGDDLASGVLAVDDGFLITGYSDPGPEGQRDILLLRLDGDGHKLAY